MSLASLSKRNIKLSPWRFLSPYFWWGCSLPIQNPPLFVSFYNFGLLFSSPLKWTHIQCIDLFFPLLVLLFIPRPLAIVFDRGVPACRYYLKGPAVGYSACAVAPLLCKILGHRSPRFFVWFMCLVLACNIYPLFLAEICVIFSLNSVNLYWHLILLSCAEARGWVTES